MNFKMQVSRLERSNIRIKSLDLKVLIYRLEDSHLKIWEFTHWKSRHLEKFEIRKLENLKLVTIV